MNKHFCRSRIFMIIACVAMLLCFATGISATEYPVSYLQNDSHSTSGAVNVTVTVEGVDIPYAEIPVTLSAKTEGEQTVADALAAINNNDNSSYIFWEEIKDDDGNVIDIIYANSETKYFSIIWDIENDHEETGNGTGYSGWAFRINGGFPLLPPTEEFPVRGASIKEATIINGDVISIYLDNPIASTSSAKFARVNNISYSNGVVTAAVKESHQYFQGANLDWIITPFADLNGVIVKVLDANGNVKGTATSSDGAVSIVTGSLPSGTYSVKVLGTNDGLNITNTTVVAAFTVQ